MTGYSVPNHIMSYLYKKYEEIQRFKCFGFKTEDFSNNTQFLRLRPYQRKYVLKEMAIRYESFKLEKAKAIFEILASYFIQLYKKLQEAEANLQAPEMVIDPDCEKREFITKFAANFKNKRYHYLRRSSSRMMPLTPFGLVLKEYYDMIQKKDTLLGNLWKTEVKNIEEKRKLHESYKCIPNSKPTVEKHKELFDSKILNKYCMNRNISVIKSDIYNPFLPENSEKEISLQRVNNSHRNSIENFMSSNNTNRKSIIDNYRKSIIDNPKKSVIDYRTKYRTNEISRKKTAIDVSSSVQVQAKDGSTIDDNISYRTNLRKLWPQPLLRKMELECENLKEPDDNVSIRMSKSVLETKAVNSKSPLRTTFHSRNFSCDRHGTFAKDMTNYKRKLIKKGVVIGQPKLYAGSSLKVNTKDEEFSVIDIKKKLKRKIRQNFMNYDLLTKYHPDQQQQRPKNLKSGNNINVNHTKHKSADQQQMKAQQEKPTKNQKYKIQSILSKGKYISPERNIHNEQKHQAHVLNNMLSSRTYIPDKSNLLVNNTSSSQKSNQKKPAIKPYLAKIEFSNNYLLSKSKTLERNNNRKSRSRRPSIGKNAPVDLYKNNSNREPLRNSCRDFNKKMYCVVPHKSVFNSKKERRDYNGTEDFSSCNNYNDLPTYQPISNNANICNNKDEAYPTPETSRLEHSPVNYKLQRYNILQANFKTAYNSPARSKGLNFMSTNVKNDKKDCHFEEYPDKCWKHNNFNHLSRKSTISQKLQLNNKKEKNVQFQEQEENSEMTEGNGVVEKLKTMDNQGQRTLVNYEPADLKFEQILRSNRFPIDFKVEKNNKVHLPIVECCLNTNKFL